MNCMICQNRAINPVELSGNRLISVFFRPIRRQLQSAGWYRLVGVTNYGLIIEISQNSSHLHSSCAAGSTACLRANISLQFAVLILFPWQRKKVGEKPFIDLQSARVWICRVSIFLQIWRVTIFVKMFRNIYEVLLFNRESGGKSHLRVRFGRQTTLIDNWRKSDVSCWVGPLC